LNRERDIEPVLLNPGDPSSQDEALFEAGSAENYARFGGGTLSPAQLHAAEQAFHEAYLAWLAGAGPFAALEPLARAAGLAGERRHDKRRLHDARVPLPDSVLADVVEDEVADARVLVERITGNPYDRPPTGALAALAWMTTIGERRAVDAWFEDERDRALTHAMRCVDRAPPCLYRDGVPLLPLSRQQTPAGGPPGVYVARAYRLGEGWGFSCKLDLPACPDAAVLERRLLVESWRIRAEERRATWEDVLRRRSEVVYRASSEGAWRSMRGA